MDCIFNICFIDEKSLFMARRAIPIIAFPQVRCMFIYMFVSPTRVCVVYVVKEVTSFPGARSISGVAHKRTRDQALHTSRKKSV